MHLFKMRGSWNRRIAFLYDLAVASGIGHMYDALAGFFFSDLPAGCRLLDLGCGSGHAAIRIAEQNPRAQVTGIDLSEGQIARAIRRGAGVPNLSFEVGDAMDLRLPDGSFDIVLSVASIKHWPDQARGLAQMLRVCKPDGRIWVIEAHTGCTKEEAGDFVANWRFVIPGTRPLVTWYFRKFVGQQGLGLEELAGLLDSAGLADVHAQQIPGQPLIIGTARPPI